MLIILLSLIIGGYFFGVLITLGWCDFMPTNTFRWRLLISFMMILAPLTAFCTICWLTVYFPYLWIKWLRTGKF